jgi:hypothetical protein
VLHRTWGGFKIVLLRHVETQEVAHLGYTVQRDDSLRLFDALSRILAEGSRNYTQAVITLADDSLLRVDCLATWEVGHERRYKSRLSVIAENAAEIKRRAFSGDRSVVDRAADVYPVRIETNDEAIRIVYSNHDEKSVPQVDCVALQLCKEEIPERVTRYEINQIEDSFKGNRINLMSFDLSPYESPDEPRHAAEQLGQLLDCEVVDHLAGSPVLDHLTSSSESRTGLRLPARPLSLAIAAVTLVAVSSLMFHFYGGEKASREEADSVELEPKDEAPDGAPPPKPRRSH